MLVRSDEIVRRDVESYQSDWFKIEEYHASGNKNKTFILESERQDVIC